MTSYTTQKTRQLTYEEAQSQAKWYLVDLEKKTLGRAVTQIASVLRGKHKPTFTPHVDGGDFVVVINAAKVHLTGRKWSDKLYYRHTGYPGGLIATSAKDLRSKHPEEIIKHAVKGMLPKGPLGRRMIKKLKVYSAHEHPHAAQQPQPLSV